MMLSRNLALLALVATATLARAQSAPGGDLNQRFANGIVAVAEDKIITVADVNREVYPLIPQIQREAKSDAELNQKIEQLQDSVIQDLIDRVLIIKEFRKKKDGDNERRIPDSYMTVKSRTG